MVFGLVQSFVLFSLKIIKQLNPKYTNTENKILANVSSHKNSTIL